jgi:hypothetical protein
VRPRPPVLQDYAGRLGYIAARVVRFLACVLIYLPVVGVPALFWLGALQLWNVITWPFRAARWLWDRVTPRRA